MKARHDTAIRFSSTYAIALETRKSRYLPRVSEDNADKPRTEWPQREEPHTTLTVTTNNTIYPVTTIAATRSIHLWA
ncbi:hypothetical protein RR46_02838 [Papilio xuthus]|uniref:Uncharacterized protein n=1 Tax=Papilio xuthus TaxID=66420 RepID=A0A194QHJ1_PAPXU|nr:hypothetical protein RR46_02838 [Papilio xuthus]